MFSSSLFSKVLSRQLALSQQKVGTLSMELEQCQEDARGAVSALHVLAGSYAHLQTTLNQALTRLASYEDRMMMQTRRLAAVKGTQWNVMLCCIVLGHEAFLIIRAFL